MKARCGAAACLFLLTTLGCLGQGIITTVAGGNPNSLGDGGPATNANLNEPTSAVLDSVGNLYIADYMNNRIRKVDVKGIITTVAGNGTSDSSGDGGPAISAAVHLPWGVAVDGGGNIYFAERINNRVRRVSPDGIITTVAGTGTAGFSGDGGAGSQAQLHNPFGLAVDRAGNLYIADTVNHRIRKVDQAGIISTVAGSGTPGYSGDGGAATKAAMFNPSAVALDSAGNLFVGEGNHIRKVNTVGIISTLAGNASSAFSGDGGPATSASLATPEGVTVDGAGNVYIGDSFNNRVRKIDTAGIITTIAGGTTSTYGDGGPAAKANLALPVGVMVDTAGNLYIADTNHNAIRKITGVAGPAGPSIAADGVVNGASFQPGIVPNSWATILGNTLSSVSDTWDKFIVNGKLPTSLDGVTVTIGGKSAYLYYVSPGQINLLVPDIGFGPQQVVVMNSVGTSAAFTVTSNQYGPAFFPWPGNQAVATRQDFSLAAKNGMFAGATTVPAKPGDVIILWGTGFGPTNPVAPAGVQVPSDQTYSTSALPTVTINNIQATVYGAALAPGYVGLYQVAIQVPASLADGDYPLQATIGGVQSPGGIVLTVKK